MISVLASEISAWINELISEKCLKQHGHIISAPDMLVIVIIIVICWLNHDTKSTSSTASPWAGHIKGDLTGPGLTRYMGPSHPAPQLASPGVVRFLQMITLKSCV